MRGLQHVGGAIAIVLCCVALYANTLDAPFVFDDVDNIKNNEKIRITQLDFASLRTAGLESPSRYRPLANASFAVNYFFSGYETRAYHVVNVTIHAMNGLLVYALAMILFRLSVQTSSRPRLVEAAIPWAALFAALIFISHPLQTQSVTYIVQRMNSMAAMFYMLALLLWLLGREAPRFKRWSWWSIGAVCWVLALGSKQIAATLPLVLFGVEWFFFRDLRTAWLKTGIKLAIVTAIALGVVSYLLFDPSFGYASRDFTMGQRVLTQFRVVTFYVSQLLWPLPSRLNLIHEYQTSISLIDPITTLTSLIFLSGLFALLVALARQYRLLSFGLLWFFVHLAIESSIIGLEMAFEHRLYLPMLGFALIVSQCVLALFQTRRTVAGVIAISAVVALSGATHVRNRVWNDPVTLWADVVEKSPGRARARSNLGTALTERGDFEPAIEHLKAANQLDPTVRRVASNLAYAHNNVAYQRVVERRIPDAIYHYSEAALLRPREQQITNSLAWLLATCGNESLLDADESIRLSEEAARATSRRNPAILDTLAAGYAAAGRFGEAVATAQESVELYLERGDRGQAATVQGRMALYRQRSRYVDPRL